MAIVTVTQSSIDAAAAALRAGNLVVFPTETVYGLGALAANDMAVARLYQAKQRPKVNPLISHFADTESALAAGKITEIASRLAEEFWPGPLTLIIDRHAKSPTCLLATAGMDNLAIRVPDHEVARALIISTGGPVVAPSANMSGKLSPSCASHISEQLAASCAFILDGGPCSKGLESTVIDCRKNGSAILRPGPITPALIYSRTGYEIGFFEGAPSGSQPILSPGMISSHYAPEAPIRLNAASVRDGEVFIGFGTPPEGIVPDLSFSKTGDLTEACARLFSVLHEADSQAQLIAIAPIPMAGLGIAINDRLVRAAAERP